MKRTRPTLFQGGVSPRKLTTIVVLLALAIGLGFIWRWAHPRHTAPPPFPCIATAKTGWLTAVTKDAMLRLEWGNGAGRVGVATADGPIRWEPRDEGKVRTLALEVLAPISLPVRSDTSDKVSLFAGCDGVGSPWRGESSRGSSRYRDCLRPEGHESRPDCLVRVFRDRGVLEDEAPGAVADRILAAVTAGGIVLPPVKSPWVPPRGDPTLFDRAVDLVAPQAAPDFGDF